MKANVLRNQQSSNNKDHVILKKVQVVFIDAFPGFISGSILFQRGFF